MKLEDQVCSLELAKKLFDLSVPQESLFYWVNNFRGIQLAGKDNIEIEWSINPSSNKGNWSAFTVSELFELLPAFIDTKQNEPFNGFWFALNKRRALNIKYIANYHCDTAPFGERPCDLFSHNIYDEKLADCLAKVLIDLLEKKFI